MSEVKLNLIDAHQTLTGTIHGADADRCVAALSAEPETVAELETALYRYMKSSDHTTPFACFRSNAEVDPEPWDAGLVIIDLAARIVAAESTYCEPQPEGEVCYHDGTQATDISILYRVPADWLFVNSFEAYRWSSDRRRQKRAEDPPFDTRAILYGAPLLEFIVDSVSALDPKIFSDLRAEISHPASILNSEISHSASLRSEISDPEIALAAPAHTSAIPHDYDYRNAPDYPAHGALSKAITNIHATWLLTPRADLRGESPRQVMLEKQDFIDFDLHTRCLQWSVQGEGPPCLAPDSFAYRFAGFGTHEWVVYYDLVRYLLMSATALRLGSHRGSSPTVREGVIVGSSVPDQHGHEHAHRGGSPTVREGVIAAEIDRGSGPTVREGVIAGEIDRGSSPTVREGVTSTSSNNALMRKLDQIKTEWLENSDKYDGRVPAIIIDNERKRLPQAASAAELLIDEDCECCRMMAMEAEMGFGPTFWHLDGCNMDDGFAFSHYLTVEEWETENQQREEFNRKFELEWAEREQRIARGGEIVDETSLSDPF